MKDVEIMFALLIWYFKFIVATSQSTDAHLHRAAIRKRDAERDRSGPFGDEAKLLKRIMRGYESAVRPVRNASHNVMVKMGFSLTQILDVDEKNQVLTTNVWFEQEWNDEKLLWEPELYNGLTRLRIPPDLIWRPDIILYNGVDDFGDKVYSQCLAMVDNNGTIFWAPIANLKSSCKLDLTYFPFDDQECKLKFGSWTYDGFQVNLTNTSTELDMTNYIINGGWDIIKTVVERNVVYYPCCIEPYPDVTFTIYLRRRTLYYLINVVVPCILLSVLSLMGFWLPVDTGEKVSLGLTVLLAFYVLGLSMADRIPETSEYIPLIGLYLSIIMVLTAFSVIMCVFIIHMHSKGDKSQRVPPWLYKITSVYLAKMMCMSSHIQHQQQQHRHPPVHNNSFIMTSTSSHCEETRLLKMERSPDSSSNITVQLPHANSTFQLVPLENSGNYLLRREPDLSVNNNDNIWLRDNGHIPTRHHNPPQHPHPHQCPSHDECREDGDHHSVRDVPSNEEMWYTIAEVWDRFFLLLDFICVSVSTFAILIVMPLMKTSVY